MDYTVFIINPGSTSTKIAVYTNEQKILSVTISHSEEQINAAKTLQDAFPYRSKAVYDELKKNRIDPALFDCIVSRGCPLRPLKAGVYHINAAMKEDILLGAYGLHASSLGPLIASEMAEGLGIPGLIADPVTVDELEEAARITGLKEIRRRTVFHALNQRAVARKHAAILSVPYEELNLIVAHLGGGITIGLHKQGQVTDVNNALDGEGPFSPDRTGSLTGAAVADLCFSGNYSRDEIGSLLAGNGGFRSLVGTGNMLEVKKMIQDKNPEAELAFRAFVYRLAKEIGSLAAAADGMIDGILLTGGIARWKELVSELRKKVTWIAPISVYPGEYEMEALRDAGLRVLRNEETPKEY